MDGPVDLSQLDVEARDERGWTNVHIAVHNNRPDVLDFLLRSGAEVRVRGHDGETPLHLAARLDSQPSACALLRRPARRQLRDLLEARSRAEGARALHVAARAGAFGVAWLLLSCGADFEARDAAGARPLDLAAEPRTERLLHAVELDSRLAEQRRHAALRARLQAHPFFELDASLHARNAAGLTTLQLALLNADVDLAEAVVELRTRKEKDEPPVELLMCLGRLARLCDDMKAQLNALLRMCEADAGPRPELALATGVGLLGTALEVSKLYAHEQQHLQLIDETLEVLQFDGRPPDENARYHRKLFTDQKTELYSFLDILKLTIGAPIALLLNKICTVYLGPTSRKYDLTEDEKSSAVNLDLNKQDANGWTPLHYAVHNDKEDMVKALLELKCDATLVTKKNKKTPLHMAAKNGNLKIVELLLEHVKADGYVDEISEPKGLTAVHFAAKAGRLDIVKCLLRNGANYCATDKKGRCCIELTKDAKVTEFLKLVKESFEIAEAGEASKIANELKSLQRDDLTAVANARNTEGFNLTTIVKSKCDSDVYSQLFAVLSDDADSVKDAR